MTSSAYSYQEATCEMATAVKEQNAENIRFFHHEGADPNFHNSLGLTLLQNAANDGRLISAAALLEVGADPDIASGPSGWTAMHYAAYRGNTGMAVLLLKHKGNPEIRSRLGGDTVLHTAAFNGTLDLVKTLVEAGADVFAKDDRGNTAMQIAIYRSQEKLQLSGKPFTEVAAYLKDKMHEVELRAEAARAQQELVAADVTKLKSLKPERFRLRPRHG